MVTFAASPAPPAAPGAVATPAPLPRRLAAIIYDGLLLAGVLVGAAGLAMGGVALVSGGGESIKAGGALTGHPLFQTYLMLVCFLFYGGFWVHGGQTLGLRAWRLRVQRCGGGNPGWRQALRRFLSGGLWLAVLTGVHGTLQPGIGWSLLAGGSALLLLLALRLPDRCSATELVLLLKPNASGAAR